MKKFVLLMLILGLASVSQAGVIGLKIGGSSTYVGTPGETVNIQLIADEPANAVDFYTLVEGDAAVATTVIDMGGTLNSVTPNASWTVTSAGYIDNYQGNLFDTFNAYAVPEIAADAVLLTFNYTIDAAWDGTPYWVSPLEEGKLFYYDVGMSFSALESEGNLLINEEPVYVPITGVQIIPEPMTISLLSLGGLIALRRRKR